MMRVLERFGAGKFLGVVLFAWLALAGSLQAAEPEDTDAWIAQASDTLETVESQLASLDPETADADAVAAALKTVTSIRGRAQPCAADTEAELARIDEALTSLGEAQGREPTDIARGRKDLENQRKLTEQRLTACRLLVVQSQELAGKLTAAQQAILAQRLLARGPNLYRVMQNNLASPQSWVTSFWRFLELEGSEGLPQPQQWLGLLAAFLLGGALGFGLRKLLFRANPSSDQVAGTAANFALALAVQTRRDLPVWCALLAPAVYLLVVMPLQPLPLVSTTAIALALFAPTLSLINTLLLPHAPAQDWLSRPVEVARALGRRLKFLASLWLIGYLLFFTSLREAASEDLYLLLRAAFATALIVTLADIVWLIRRMSWALFGRSARLLLIAALLLVLVAEYLGYRNLASYLLGGLMGTLFGLGIAVLLTTLLNDLFDGLDEGRLRWQRALRVQLSLKHDDLMPGLTWVRLLSMLAVWGAFAAWVIVTWGLTEQGRSMVLPYLIDGFAIGSFQIVPTYVLGAIVALALLLNLTSFVKLRVLPRWLRHTRMNHGAREAIGSVTGYLGIAASVLVALAIAGFEMQNLALIAGALSVGIGFGLQNVVNNFVSGLILLFERPIRRGDWIVAGNTEGYVKSINIRSTQIQTFDRADVIVPNSELISQQVTNWMLADQYGRVVVPVGVAYHSDPEKVRDILLAVAAQHPLVVQEHPEFPPPRVLFRRFGDSSLDFELRCFITKIDERLNTISDLNFAIFQAFKEAGIEIPFPQRDLHIREWPPRAGDNEVDETKP